MTFMIWGNSAVMTLNVKVAQATHEAPFSPCGRRDGEEGGTVMTFMIWGNSAVMTVNVKVAQATHEAPFSPCGRRDGEEGGTVMTFMIWGNSAVMTVSRLVAEMSMRERPKWQTDGQESASRWDDSPAVRYRTRLVVN
jgi:antitoxin component of MazEF toxin-antitoxin module